MSGVKPRHFCVTGFSTESYYPFGVYAHLYQVRHCVWTLTFLTTSPRLEIKHLDLSEQQRGIEPTCQESGTLTMRPPPGHGNLNNRICMLSRPRLDHAVILSSAVYRINFAGCHSCLCRVALGSTPSWLRHDGRFSHESAASVFTIMDYTNSLMSHFRFETAVGSRAQKPHRHWSLGSLDLRSMYGHQTVLSTTRRTVRGARAWPRYYRARARIHVNDITYVAVSEAARAHSDQQEPPNQGGNNNRLLFGSWLCRVV
uniref:Uncharacterized protein n=1 Tax=Timema tahoe TaxID=61484 RepID=A0A7R9FFF6_9NEOP|nr:unnamed protein product [Timema tahoe]